MTWKSEELRIAWWGIIIAFAACLSSIATVAVTYWQYNSSEKERVLVHAQLMQAYKEYDDKRLKDDEADRRRRSPLLAVLEPCVTVPVTFADEMQVPSGDKHRVIAAMSAVGAKCESCSHATAPLAVASNFATGPAFECCYRWHVKLVDYRVKNDVRVDSGDPIPMMQHDFWPKQLSGVEVASVMNLPRALAADLDLDIVVLKGFLVLACSDAAGRPHEFAHAFEARPYYDPLKPGYVKKKDSIECGASIQFRFSGHAWCDGPFPRLLDKDPLEYLSTVRFDDPYTVQGFRRQEPQEVKDWLEPAFR